VGADKGGGGAVRHLEVVELAVQHRPEALERVLWPPGGAGIAQVLVRGACYSPETGSAPWSLGINPEGGASGGTPTPAFGCGG
jgi:hypothetical protein